jgi:hypothetical protein
MRKDRVVRTEYVEAVCAAFKRAEGSGGRDDPGLQDKVREAISSAYPDYTVEEWETGLKEAHSRGLFSDERDKRFKTPQGVDTRLKPCPEQARK